jgi:hypothetical protein
VCYLPSVYTGQDLVEISSKSHPMITMVMVDIRSTVVSRCVSCVTCPHVPECLAREIDTNKLPWQLGGKLFSGENEPSSRSLSLNRSQYGGCSTKYNSSAGT